MSKLVDKVFNLFTEVCGDNFTTRDTSRSSQSLSCEVRVPEGLHQPEDLFHWPADVTLVDHHVPHSPIMYLTLVALAGASQSLATPMLIMERERSVKMEKPAGPPNPPRDTSLLIHLLTARGLSLVTPTISHWFLVNSSICYLKLRTSEESTSKSRGKKKSTK